MARPPGRTAEARHNGVHATRGPVSAPRPPGLLPDAQILTAPAPPVFRMRRTRARRHRRLDDRRVVRRALLGKAWLQVQRAHPEGGVR